MMLLDRLNVYDLEELERVKNPTQDMILALIKKLREVQDELDEVQLEHTSLRETLEVCEIDI